MTTQLTDASAVRPERSAQASWRARVLERVHSRRGVWLVVALGCALALPSLTIGLSTDDRIFVQRLRDGAGVPDFQLTSAQIESARQTGALSWWTNPECSVHFFRPLSSLTHYVEHRIYPNAPWAMHLLNLLLYAALVGLAWQLYRLFLPNHPGWAALAALLFTIDDGHAPSIGWIAGRNTLLASVFTLAALWCHARSRTSPRRLHFALASAACVALALCSAEAGLSVFAYLFAYALVLDSGSLRQRLASLSPALAAGAVWGIVYVSGGYGTRGAGFYRDVSTPFATLAEGLADLPTWLFSLVGPSAASAMIFFPPAPIRLAFGLLALPLLAAVYAAAPRTRENRFFALGALLCLPPLFMTIPQDRLLMLASFGAFGLLASVIATAKDHARRFVRVTRRVLIATHLVVAPLMFPLSLNQTRPVEYGARAIADAVPRQPPAQVVFVNLPMELLSIYAWHMLLDEPDRPRPSSIPQLYGGNSPLVVRRLDARTLELYAERGWGDVAPQRTFASLASLPRAGEERSAASIRIRVVESTESGVPRRVQFEFPDALESPDRLWFAWRGTGLEPWQPPAIGAESGFAPLDVFQSLKAF